MSDQPDSQKKGWLHLEACLLGLLLLAPLALDPWGSLSSYYKGIWLNLTASLLLTVFLFRAFFRRGFQFVPSWVDLPWVLFLAFAALTLLWAHNRPVHLQRLTLLLSVTVGFFLVRIRIAEGAPLVRFPGFLVFTGTLVAIIDSIAITNASGIAGFKSSTLLFPHNNVASLYIIVLVCLAYALCFCVRTLRAKGLCLLSLGIFFVYLYILKSRAAWIESCIGILLITAVMILRTRIHPLFETGSRLLRNKFFLLLLALGITVVFLLPLSEGFSAWAKATFMRGVNFFELDFQRTFFRLDIWRKTMAMVSDNLLLGVGLGNFSVIFPLYHKMEMVRSHPHSEYFNVLVETGLIGMIFYVFFLILLLRAFLSAFLGKGGTPQTQRLTLGLGCALTMEAVHGFVEPPMIFEASVLNLMVCSALLVSLEGIATGRKKIRIGPGGPVRRFVLPLVACVGLYFVLPDLGEGLTRGRDLKLGNEAYQAKNYAEAETIFRSLSEKSWENYYPHLLVGDACYYQEKHEEALKEYERAAMLRPYHFEVFYRKGMALKRLRRLNDALYAVLKALEYNPGHVIAQVERIKLLILLGQLSDANQHLDVFMRSRRPSATDFRRAGLFSMEILRRAPPGGKLEKITLRRAMRYYQKAQEKGEDVQEEIRLIRHLMEQKAE